MPWYAASVIVALDPVLKASKSQTILLWENVYLVEAEDEDGARAEAERLGRVLNDRKNPLVINKRQVTTRYCGVRKVLTVDPYPYGSHVTSPATVLETGCEVSFNVYSVGAASDLESLVGGKSVTLTYLE